MAYDVPAAIYIDTAKWCTHSGYFSPAYAHQWKCYSILPLPTHTYVCSLVVPTLQTCIKVFRKLKIAAGRWHLPKPEETRTENFTENTGTWDGGSMLTSLEALVALCVLLDAQSCSFPWFPTHLLIMTSAMVSLCGVVVALWQH